MQYLRDRIVPDAGGPLTQSRAAKPPHPIERIAGDEPTGFQQDPVMPASHRSMEHEPAISSHRDDGYGYQQTSNSGRGGGGGSCGASQPMESYSHDGYGGRDARPMAGSQMRPGSQQGDVPDRGMESMGSRGGGARTSDGAAQDDKSGRVGDMSVPRAQTEAEFQRITAEMSTLEVDMARGLSKVQQFAAKKQMARLRAQQIRLERALK